MEQSISYLSPESPRPVESKPPYNRGVRYLLLGFLIIASVFYLSGRVRQFSITNPFAPIVSQTPKPTPDSNYTMPQKETNRFDILVLGIRGENDPDANDGGPLLTDSIQVFSYDKMTKKSSLISLPRDLFVTIHDDKKNKLNTAYEYGYYHSGNSLQFIKDKISQITGIYIDQVVVFDFSAFREIIDALGGIDITLTAPFTENQQWGKVFSLPVGLNHLDGQTALYYVRSRYSSNDFDRSRRQQQVIFAIKDKLLKLNFLGDPVKSFSILTLIRNDIKTDIGVWNINQILDLAKEVKFETLKRAVISTDNLVFEARDNGVYILLPKAGDLTVIKQFFQNILE